MAQEQLILGPFAKGITAEEALYLDDYNTASDLVNFDIMDDGTLVTRKPLAQKKNLGYRGTPIGFFVTAVGESYTIIDTISGVKAVRQDGVVTTITASNSHVAIQYNDTLWVVCYNGASGRWTPGGGFVAVSGMPLGCSAVIKNDRLLIAGITTTAVISWSAVGDFLLWTGAGGGEVKVRTKDGGYLQRLLIFNDQIVVFKTRGIWFLSFTDDPGLGTLRIISSTVGLHNTHSAVAKPEACYFYFSGFIMRIMNNAIDTISNQLGDSISNDVYQEKLFPDIPGQFGTPSNPDVPYNVNAFAHTIDDYRILFKIDSNYWVYHIKLEAWTRYAFDAAESPGYGMLIPNGTTDSYYELVSGGLTSGDFQLYAWLGRGVTKTEEPNLKKFDAYILSKTLEFGAKTFLKRLFWWGVDLHADGVVEGSVAAYVVKRKVTWDQIRTTNWEDLHTWDNLLGLPDEVFESNYVSSYNQRTFIKFGKSGRHRRLRFKVKIQREEVPGRLYAITANVKRGETVAAKES